MCQLSVADGRADSTEQVDLESIVQRALPFMDPDGTVDDPGISDNSVEVTAECW